METIIIMGISAVTLVVSIITLILVLVRTGNQKPNEILQNNMQMQNGIQISNNEIASAESGIVFCRNCGGQFDSSSPVCPSCKTPH